MKTTLLLASCLAAAVAIVPPRPHPDWRLVSLHPDMPVFWMDPATADSLATQFNHLWGFMDITEAPEPTYGPQARKDFLYPSDMLREELVNEYLTYMDQSKPEEYLLYLSELNNRYRTSETGVQGAEYIRDTLEAIISQYRRSDASCSLFSHSFAQPSVICRVQCTNCTSDEMVILGAHEDSTAPNMPSGRSPGADDDGTGTVTVMEAFRLLMEVGFLPNRPLEFHFYAGEEGGLLGSADIAKAYASEGKKVYSMLQLDMNGYNPNGNALLRVYYDTAFMDLSLTNWLKEACDVYGEIGQTTGSYGYAASDHASWARNGYPAAHVKESTSYPYIHTANDSYQYIDFKYLMQFVRVSVGYVVELTNGDIASRY